MRSKNIFLSFLCLLHIGYCKAADFVERDPRIWEKDIIALEEKTRTNLDNSDRILFVGSSSIRLWPNLEENMHPFKIIQHGFGGARINDVLFYSDRLINQFFPKAVVIFVGTNDINLKAIKPAEKIKDDFVKLIDKIKIDLPETPIFYINITPSPKRWSVWKHSIKTNNLILESSKKLYNVFTIDTCIELIGVDGEPDPNMYQHDKLHLSQKGYDVWKKIIKKILLEKLTIQN